MNEGFKRLWSENKVTLCATSAVILLQTVVGVVLWDRLPEMIVTNFDMNNQPAGQSSRLFAVLGMPLLFLALHWACATMSCSASHKLRETNAKIRQLVLFIIPAVSLLTMTMIYSNALGVALPAGQLVSMFIGLVFIVAGLYMPRIRQNRVVGIKLPWTLADEENWDMTHRKAGPLWMAGGLGIAISGWYNGGWVIPMAMIIALLLIPAIYSFVIYMKKHGK